MKKEYMLISITDRELDEPKFFETYEEAHHAMVDDLTSVAGVNVEHLKDDEELSEYLDVYEMSAYYAGLQQIDWQIIHLPSFGLCYNQGA